MSQGGYSSIAIKCPYFSYDEKCRIHCEGDNHLGFPSSQERKEYCETYCGNIEGWKHCTIAKARNEHFERADRAEKIARKENTNGRKKHR